MGFWTDKNKKQNTQDHQQGTEFDNNLFSAGGVDSFRECRRDPFNEDYLFCKDVKQNLDSNGKWSREEGEESRVSMDELSNNSLGPSVVRVNIFKNIFQGLNEFIQPRQLDKEIQSIFQQFKSYFFNPQRYLKQVNDNDNIQKQHQQSHHHPHTSFSSYSSSSSRNCRNDLSDNNYLLCTTTTTNRTPDGQQTTDVKEERIFVQQNRLDQLPGNHREFPSSSLFALGVPFFRPSQNEAGRGQPSQKNQQFNQGNSNTHNNSNAGGDNGYNYPDFQRKTKKGYTEIHDL